MRTNIDATYDKVISEIQRYFDFTAKLSTTVVRRCMPGLLVKPRLLLKVLRAVGTLTRPRLPDEIVSLYTKHANPRQKASSFFPIYISTHWFHSFACYLQDKFTSADFASVLKIHTLRGKEVDRPRATSRYILGVILGAGTLILKSVPKEVVIRLKIDYGDFEVWTFGLTLVAVCYVVLAIAPLWWIYSRSKTQHEALTDILEYTALLASSAETERIDAAQDGESAADPSPPVS